jgi:hypothetical protein
MTSLTWLILFCISFNIVIIVGLYLLWLYCRDHPRNQFDHRHGRRGAQGAAGIGNQGSMGNQGPINTGHTTLRGFVNVRPSSGTDVVTAFAYQANVFGLPPSTDLPTSITIDTVISACEQVIPISGTMFSIIASCVTNSADGGPSAAIGMYWQSAATTTNTYSLIMRTDFTGTSNVSGPQSSTLSTTSTNGGTDGSGSLAVTAGDRYVFVLANRNWTIVNQYNVVALL